MFNYVSTILRPTSICRAWPGSVAIARQGAESVTGRTVGVSVLSRLGCRKLYSGESAIAEVDRCANRYRQRNGLLLQVEKKSCSQALVILA